MPKEKQVCAHPAVPGSDLTSCVFRRLCGESTPPPSSSAFLFIVAEVADGIVDGAVVLITKSCEEEKVPNVRNSSVM